MRRAWAPYLEFMHNMHAQVAIHIWWLCRASDRLKISLVSKICLSYTFYLDWRGSHALALFCECVTTNLLSNYSATFLRNALLCKPHVMYPAPPCVACQCHSHRPRTCVGCGHLHDRICCAMIARIECLHTDLTHLKPFLIFWQSGWRLRASQI